MPRRGFFRLLTRQATGSNADRFPSTRQPPRAALCPDFEQPATLSRRLAHDHRGAAHDAYPLGRAVCIVRRRLVARGIYRGQGMAHGTHFFMNPGPTNIPERILRAMDRGAIDFTGAEFKAISEECFAGLKRVFKTDGTILAYAATGHGAWEAALVNLFSPGDRILVVESGFFSLNWGMRGEAFGIDVETLPKDWRHPADPDRLEARLREDREHQIKAVLLVHCETSTGVVN